MSNDILSTINSLPAMDIKYNCTKCNDDGVLIDSSGPSRVYKGLCECQVPEWNLKTWKYIYSVLPDRLKKDLYPDFDGKARLSDKQKELFLKLVNNSWVYGESTHGKSHTCLEYFRYKMLSEKSKFFKARYYNGSRLNKLFTEQYEDKEIRYELDSIGKGLNMIMIDDIDKIGGFTEHKAYRLLEFFEVQIDKIEYVLITSNISMADFCSRIKEKSVSEPLFSRIKDFTPQEILLKNT